MSKEDAGRVRQAVAAEMEAERKRSSTPGRRVTWPVRIDRGPGIDGLPTVKLLGWLDVRYQQAVVKEHIRNAPQSISDGFWQVLGEAFEPGQPADRTKYARKLRNMLERNDSEYKSYLATTTVVTTGLAGAGVVGALTDGARGLVDTDLKTALVILAGITLTTLLGTLMRALESRLPPRQPSAMQNNTRDVG